MCLGHSQTYLVHSEPLYEVVMEVPQWAENECSKYPCSSKAWKIEFISFLFHDKLSNHIAETKQNCKYKATHTGASLHKYYYISLVKFENYNVMTISLICGRLIALVAGSMDAAKRLSYFTINLQKPAIKTWQIIAYSFVDGVGQLCMHLYMTVVFPHKISSPPEVMLFVSTGAFCSCALYQTIGLKLLRVISTLPCPHLQKFWLPRAALLTARTTAIFPC